MKGHGQLIPLLNGWNKKIGKLMVGIGNRGFAADERSRRRTVGSQAAKISQAVKISRQKTTPNLLRHLQNKRLKIVRKRTCK